MNKAYEPKFNYILNDLALSNLITRNLYSKDVTYDDKRELENQIELIQQENKQLKDNWNKLKKWLNNFHKSSEFEQWEIVNKMQKLEQGSDNNE